MWCYQKPGFEALLLAELQRQQQCSQFCDTFLKADGVSVPAHSCVLSAISPCVSSALSSTPAPPSGQSHLLEFRALGRCTLLHMVRLLYSGEMAGEGEKEKQDAIAAAAKLGIHGLVEVTKSDCKGRIEEGGGQHREVGVQTEPLMFEQNEGRQGNWRRDVRDGSTLLWKEPPSNNEKDIWTQTEELEVYTAPPAPSAASFETTDVTVLQSLGQTDSHFALTQVPFVPISLIYPSEQNQMPQTSSGPSVSMQDAASAGQTSVAVEAQPYHSVLPFSTQTTLCAADPQNWWPGPQGAAGNFAETEEWDSETLEQFQGNIPGFISYFLNSEKDESSCRGRARGRQRTGVGGARRAGTGERRARRPRARTGVRRRGGLMQTVDVQDVGVSKGQKLFLHRWGMRTPMTGQGGGAAGRKLFLKTRELLKPAKRKRRYGQVWEFSKIEGMTRHSEGGGGNGTQQGRKSTTKQCKMDILPVGRNQRVRANLMTSDSFSSPPMPLCNVHPLSYRSLSLQPPPSPIMPSNAAAYMSPAASLIHTTALPPPSSPPHEDQPEHIDRLLEEVMMGLDILPNNKNTHSQAPPPTSSRSCANTSFRNNLGQSKQKCCTIGPLEAGPTFHGSTQVVAVARGASGSIPGVAPVLQQQGPGELNDILDHFLQSFEQHINSCNATENMDGERSTRARKSNKANNKKKKTQTKPENATRLQNTPLPRPVTCSQIIELQQNNKTETPQSHSQPGQDCAGSRGSPKHAEGQPEEPVKRQNKRRKSQHVFSSQKKRVRKPVSTNETKILHDRRDKQLQQMPAVKLERKGHLPFRVRLQEHNCQSLQVKGSAKENTRSSSVKPMLYSTKTYPIRSRFREAHIMETEPFLEVQPVEKQRGHQSSKRGRSRKNGQLTHLSSFRSSTPTTQLQPVEPRATNELLGEDQERHEVEVTLGPQEEAEGATMKGKKRRAQSGEETNDDATVAKRTCCELKTEPTSETGTRSSEQSNTDADDVIDVETVSLASEGECVQREEKYVKSTMWREIALGETRENCLDEDSSCDEIIDVDGDTEEEIHLEKHLDHRAQTNMDLWQITTAATPSRSPNEVSVKSGGSLEGEDIDVIGGSSPTPDPEVISWTLSSEDEEEENKEIDVVGEKTDFASALVFTTRIKGELINKIYQTEVL